MIPSPYVTDKELRERDLKEVDVLVARIAPSLRRIVAIVKKNDVVNFAIYVKEDGKKTINFVMVEEDGL